MAIPAWIVAIEWLEPTDLWFLLVALCYDWLKLVDLWPQTTGWFVLTHTGGYTDDFTVGYIDCFTYGYTDGFTDGLQWLINWLAWH